MANSTIEINGINVSADTLRVAQMMTEGKLILRTIQPRQKKEKSDKAICPCAVPIVSIRVAAVAIQRQYPKDGGEVPRHLGIYIVEHDKIERAYKKCTRPLLVDKETKETREFCYKHWETHQNASANLYMFDDIVGMGRLATPDDPFFETANKTGRKKTNDDDTSSTASGGKRTGERAQKLLDVRITLTPDIYAKLKKFQDMISGGSSSSSSSPNLEIKPIKANPTSTPASTPNILDQSTNESENDEEDAEEVDAEEEVEEVDAEEEAEEVEAEDITTTTGESLSLVEPTMTVYRTNPETEESDEIGVLVEVNAKTKTHAVSYKDKKYIIGVTMEHNDTEYYRCVITDQYFTKTMPATLVGKVKKNAKGVYVPTVNAKK
jgi:hypothetical protein